MTKPTIRQPYRAIINILNNSSCRINVQFMHINSMIMAIKIFAQLYEHYAHMCCFTPKQGVRNVF